MSLGIVQTCATAANASTSQPKTNWGSTPTNGNLLVALGYTRNQQAPAGTNSWNVLRTKETANWYLTVYFKYAASAAKIEAIDTGTGYDEWGFSFFEISGASGSVWKDLIKATLGAQNGSNATQAAGSLTTQATTTLLLSGFAGQVPSSSDTISWSGNTGWTLGSDYVASSGDAFGVYNWAAGGYQAVTGGDAYSSAQTTSANSEAWTSLYLELGAGPSPGLDGAAATAAFGSSSPITSIAANLTSFGADDVIVAVVSLSTYSASSPPTPGVTSVTASGLTFSNRFQYNPTSLGLSNKGDIEVWWAPAAAAFSGAITANLNNLNATQNLATITVFAAGGAANYLSPWDSEGSLPYGPTSPIIWSTAESPDLILAGGGQWEPFTLITPGVTGGPTWTELLAGGQVFGSAGVYTSVYFANAASPVSSDTTAIGGEGCFLDAIAGAVGGETSTGVLAFGGLSFTAHASDSLDSGVLAYGGIAFAGHEYEIETGAGALHFGGLAFVAAGGFALGAGDLAFAGISYTGAEHRIATGAGDLAFKGIAFAGLVARTETGVGVLAFGPFAIHALGFDLPVGVGRSFWTFGA